MLTFAARGGLFVLRGAAICAGEVRLAWWRGPSVNVLPVCRMLLMREQATDASCVCKIASEYAQWQMVPSLQLTMQER